MDDTGETCRKLDRIIDKKDRNLGKFDAIFTAEVPYSLCKSWQVCKIVYCLLGKLRYIFIGLTLHFWYIFSYSSRIIPIFVRIFLDFCPESSNWINKD